MNSWSFAKLMSMDSERVRAAGQAVFPWYNYFSFFLPHSGSFGKKLKYFETTALAHLIL